MFELYFTAKSIEQLKELKRDKGLAKRYSAVKEAFKKLQNNPRHPSLQTHEYQSLKGPNGEKLFEAYAEQQTPAAYRIFFCYGPEKGAMIIISVEPHP